MASRKKKFQPVAPQPPTRPKPSLWLQMGIGLLMGLVIGGTAGVAIFFAKRPTIDLGVVATASTSGKVPDKDVFATYAGSLACKECHAKAYEGWAASHHGLAERDVDPSVDRAAFDPPRTFEHGTQKTQVKATGDQFEVVAQGADAAPATYPVTRVIGVEPLRQFLVPAPGGRLQTLEASYDPHKNQWFNVYGNEDRKFGEWGHWTGRGMNWNSQCASCHNTRVRKNYDEATDAYRTEMAEKTVSCESCHGPMKRHADAYKKGGLAASAAGSFKPQKLTKDQTLHTCAACHARRADLTGDFAPGDDFHDHFSLAIPDLSELFYPDGQVKEEDYEFTAFLGSKMHAAGVRCGDCHDPHTSKTLFSGNALCMRCHNGSFQGSPVIVPEQHSFHKPDSAGNQCVNCHMPQTTYMQRHARHDHGFTIPDPLLTKEHNVPNACNRCHVDKDADWSLMAVDKWYGAKMQRPSRDRARAIARARQGIDEARPAIQRMLTEEKQPFWRAVAAGILGQWTTSPEVSPALLAALDQPDPLVRDHAVRSLAPLAMRHDPTVSAALAKRLADPARAVRVRAAWALRDVIDPQTSAANDLQRSLQFNADQPTGAAEQGSYYAARGDLKTASGYFEKAVTWDPNSAPFRDLLANVLILQDQTDRAAEQFRWAVKLAPREALYAYKLALTYQRLNQIPQARQAAQRALQVDPNYTPAADLLNTLKP